MSQYIITMPKSQGNTSLIDLNTRNSYLMDLNLAHSAQPHNHQGHWAYTIFLL